MPKVLTDPGMGRCIGCYSCMQACARMVYNDFSPHKSAIQVRTVGGMNGRLVADICRACPEPVPCVEACPNEAILVVIEPVEEKAISLREQPAPEVALAKSHRTLAPLRTQIVPVVGAALAFLGREVAPRLATYLADALERRLSLQQPAADSPTNNLAPRGSGKGGQGGRRHRRRRQDK